MCCRRPPDCSELFVPKSVPKPGLMTGRPFASAAPRNVSVLSIGKLAAGQEGYYLQAVASGVEDYYLGSGEAPGLDRAGVGAAGLSGVVEADDLGAVLDGRCPATGRSLITVRGDQWQDSREWSGSPLPSLPTSRPTDLERRDSAFTPAFIPFSKAPP
jgi:hypothetical protein